MIHVLYIPFLSTHSSASATSFHTSPHLTVLKGMNSTTSFSTVSTPTSTPLFPIYPHSTSDTSSATALQSLAFEIVGVLFAGAGLVLLVIQLRKGYSRALRNTRHVEVFELAGEEIV